VAIRSANLHRVLGVVLCMALTVVFAAMSLSSAFDREQHAPGAAAQHEHMLFGDLSIGEFSADDHHGPADENGSGDHLAGGHHYHADSGAGLLAHATDDIASFVGALEPLPREPSAHHPGLRVPGPERPPKRLTMEA